MDRGYVDCKKYESVGIFYRGWLGVIRLSVLRIRGGDIEMLMEVGFFKVIGWGVGRG